MSPSPKAHCQISWCAPPFSGEASGRLAELWHTDARVDFPACSSNLETHELGHKAESHFKFWALVVFDVKMAVMIPQTRFWVASEQVHLKP